MRTAAVTFALGAALALAGCGDAPYDPRGVDHDETLLSVSATGEAETRPDQAFFQAGVNSFAGTARAASEANARAIARVVAALRQTGVPEADIQTRAVSVAKVDYGPNKGQYQASNVLAVTVREVDDAGAAVAAATDAGANLVGGPDLRISDPEKAANTAYGAAFKAARARAEAYAEAAGMRIARVLTIRDGGGMQGNRYLPAPVAPPPPPIVAQAAMPEQRVPIMPGQTTSAVAVQVDFALVAK